MSEIRRQSIISSLVIYTGFAIGLLNTYFFAKQDLFLSDEYGLTQIFIAIATMMATFAGLTMPIYISKFYHYYNDHLPPRKNDMITWALLVAVIGFILVAIAGWVFKGLVIRKFGQNSPLLLQYYYWIFPMGFGLTIFAVLEVYTWNVGKPVLTNFLKEVQWRVFVTILILLLIAGIIKDFSLFIKLYALAYPGIALILLLYLVFTKKLHFTFTVSKVTKRYFKKIVSLAVFVYGGTIIFTLSQVFDSFVIAATLKDGLSKVGIFSLAQLLTNVIQAPQRGIIAAAIPHLSRAWKDKDHDKLQRIYQRSSINQLVFAAGFFVLILINYKHAIITFHLKNEFLLGFSALVFLGITRIVDMGTGLNSQLIGTSNYWKFELFSGIILLCFMLPLSYFLAKQYDILGPAIANLVSISIYNGIRIIFLWKKFRLFPFTVQTIYVLLLGGVCFLVCYYLFDGIQGWWGLVLRSACFFILYAGATIYFRLTPDIQPVLATIRKRLKL